VESKGSRPQTIKKANKKGKRDRWNWMEAGRDGGCDYGQTEKRKITAVHDLRGGETVGKNEYIRKKKKKERSCSPPLGNHSRGDKESHLKKKNPLRERFAKKLSSVKLQYSKREARENPNRKAWR